MPQREPLRFPNGERIAVYMIVNIEEWNIEKPVAREYVTSPAGVVTVPNVPNWSWHEYGMRVGVWRIMDALAARDLKANVAINARVCEGAGRAGCPGHAGGRLGFHGAWLCPGAHAYR